MALCCYVIPRPFTRYMHAFHEFRTLLGKAAEPNFSLLGLDLWPPPCATGLLGTQDPPHAALVKKAAMTLRGLPSTHWASLGNDGMLLICVQCSECNSLMIKNFARLLRQIPVGAHLCQRCCITNHQRATRISKWMEMASELGRERRCRSVESAFRIVA